MTGTSPSPATDLARCAIDLNDYKRGVIRSERINDVFRLLDFRHEIHEKAIYHRIVQSAIAMLGRALMLAGTGKPTLAQLYAIGEPHHAATGDDQFLRDLATHTPDGHAARRYHSIGQKILERRLYRPLMMIPGDEVYNLLPPSYQRYSQDNNEKCLRLLGAILDSTYFKPFFCFICWCVERLLDHSFATTEELDEFVEKRARSEGTLDWVRSVVPGRVILWSTPYKQLYKDPALVVRAYEHVGQIDALASHDHANHTQLPPTLLSRLRVGMEDAEARYAAMWRIYVFISDGLYYSGGLARLIEHHPCRDEERHHLEHLGHLEQAQDEILRAIKVAAEWWTEHQESDLSDRIAEGDLKELLILFLTHSTARDVEKVPSHAKDRRRACGVNLEQYAHVEPDSGCKDVRYRFDRPADLLGAVEDAGLGKEVEVAVREFFRAAKLNTGKIGHEELVDLICHIGPYIDQLADTGDLEHAARIGSKAYDDVSLREVWRKSEELTATNGEEDVATAHAAVSRTVAREKPVSNRGKKSTGREGPRRQQSSSDAAKLQFSDATGPASPSGGRVSDQQETETK